MLRNAILITTALIMTLSVACTDTERGQAILTVASISASSVPFGDILSSDGTIPSDTIDFVLQNDLRNPSGLSSTTFADILLESVTVSFTRTDGGSDKPITVKYSISEKIPASGSVTVLNFVILPGTMKLQFPLSDLLNYGFERSTNYISIRMNVTIEFAGRTVEGDPVFASGGITIEVTDWAD